VTPGVSWVSELNMRLLSPSSQEPSKSIKKNNRHSGLIQDDDKIRVDEPSKHKRTVSDIPQFVSHSRQLIIFGWIQ
jgi:hypothetical protein